MTINERLGENYKFPMGDSKCSTQQNGQYPLAICQLSMYMNQALHISLPCQQLRVWNEGMCVCLCLSVSALMAEQFDIRTQNMMEALALIISQISSKVKMMVPG